LDVDHALLDLVVPVAGVGHVGFAHDLGVEAAVLQFAEEGDPGGVRRGVLHSNTHAFSLWSQYRRPHCPVRPAGLQTRANRARHRAWAGTGISCRGGWRMPGWRCRPRRPSRVRSAPIWRSMGRSGLSPYRYALLPRWIT